jgi:hypothetical protein
MGRLGRQSPSQSMARAERSATRARVPVVHRWPKSAIEMTETMTMKHLRVGQRVISIDKSNDI